MNRISESGNLTRTLDEIKALIDGLPVGLDLATRLVIFKKNFSVSKREYRRYKGPTDDALHKIAKGYSRPNKSTLDNLCMAATAALLSRYEGLEKQDAARAGKWLASGPILIAPPPPDLPTNGGASVEPESASVELESEQKAPVAPEVTTEAADRPSSSASMDKLSEAGFLRVLTSSTQTLKSVEDEDEFTEGSWQRALATVIKARRYLTKMEWLQRPDPIVFRGSVGTSPVYVTGPKMFVAGKRPPQTASPVPFPYTAEGFDRVESELHSMLVLLESLCPDMPVSDENYRLLRTDVREIGRLHGQLAGPCRRQGLAGDLSQFDPLPWVGGIDDDDLDESFLEVAKKMGLPVSQEAAAG